MSLSGKLFNTPKAIKVMEDLLRYFPKLNDTQIRQFGMLLPFYQEWNAKINVVSRKDIENLMLHHVLHSLTIARFIQFTPNSSILDLGTGGGFPGIPLAIFFPQVNFTLIDGTRKKIFVVEQACEALGLQNVTPKAVRAEELKGSFDFVVSRAVTALDQLLVWTRPLIRNKQQNAIPNGLITLKGGM
ncbi:MAG: 16S rRNA (guanine(527)-N(7))-methyltransferase RsmG, partial [Saprospiraceae bacterium]|nr:16S rRNA (guanine(527)-N(7))-methyltransferase RsmG [Saprospiraceae bacterium]